MQDQIAACYGGFNKIVLGEDGFSVQPVVINNETKAALNGRLQLFFTGISRISSIIQVEQERSLEAKTAQLLRMKELVDEAYQALVDGRLDDFGRLLDLEWRLKRDVNKEVSNGLIDRYYAAAREAGALGGKLLGAGGGGFLLLYAAPERQQAVREALGELMEIPFRFEKGGSRILYYAPEVYNKKG